MVAWHQLLLRAARDGLRAALRSPGFSDRGRPAAGAGHAVIPRGYAGEFTGRVDLSYSPAPDGMADPGEVVWTWVPFEENDGRGKDRPVLVIGRNGPHVAVIMLTSKDHDRDAAQERRHGRVWLDVGTGPWDVKRRPSEVRLDRVMLLRPDGIRREGARMDRVTFEEVADALRRLHGWPR